MSDEEKPADPNEKVTFFGKQVTRAQIEPYIKFYDADHHLTPDDRKTMATELNWISTSSQLWGMFDASLAFFAPTFYRRYTTAKATKVAELWRNMPVKRFIHRPFVSTMMGTLTYFLSVIYHSKNSLDYQVSLLEREITAPETEQEDAESKRRQLTVWKTMVPTQMTFYYLYYWKSSQDPLLVLKDPRTMTLNPHEIHYMPPKEAENTGIVEGQHDHVKEAPHWAKIRASNGFAQAEVADSRKVDDIEEISNEEPEKSHREQSDGVENDVGGLESPVSTIEEKSEPKRSAWDRVRRGN